MDPKTLSNIDPKLRETYERVMGTTPTSSPATPPPAPVQADAAPQTPHEPPPEAPTPASLFSSSPSTDTPDTSAFGQPAVVTPYNPETTAQTNEHSMNQPLPSPASVAQAAHTQEATPLLRVLYIVGAVLFFMVYTIFWVKIFKLPFLF
jgi:hypothetical protein